MQLIGTSDNINHNKTISEITKSVQNLNTNVGAIISIDFY